MKCWIADEADVKPEGEDGEKKEEDAAETEEQKGDELDRPKTGGSETLDRERTESSIPEIIEIESQGTLTREQTEDSGTLEREKTESSLPETPGEERPETIPEGLFL